LDAWDGYTLYLMEKNQIRIIYTLDAEHFGEINGIKTVNPIPDEKNEGNFAASWRKACKLK